MWIKVCPVQAKSTAVKLVGPLDAHPLFATPECAWGRSRAYDRGNRRRPIFQERATTRTADRAERRYI